MPILNYTTKIEASKTMDEIHTLLVKAGATRIMSEYSAGKAVGITFQVATPMGDRNFTLPVSAEKVRAVLIKQKVLGPNSALEQAERVAWRIMKDWLEAQLAIIQTEMVSLDQVMLPYMVNPQGRTVYDLYCEQQLALEAGS